MNKITKFDAQEAKLIKFVSAPDNSVGFAEKTIKSFRINGTLKTTELKRNMSSLFRNVEAVNSYSELYNSDFVVWVEKTSNLLKTRRLENLDIENLIEEVEDLSRRERQDLKNRLRVLLTHLLKWQYQSNYRSYPETKNNWNENSWARTIIEQRDSIKDILSDSPSLYNFLLEVLEECYQKSRKNASKETNLELSVFPELCPYIEAEILNDEFWPELD